ncbi:MAG: hypothetical protein R6V19_04695 [Armatimonadota bacterium]
MRILLGVILGLFLFFPGIVLLQSISEFLGLYDNMTLTDGCLVMIIILQSVIIVRGLITQRSNHVPRTAEPNLGGESHSTGSENRRSRRPQGQTRR